MCQETGYVVHFLCTVPRINKYPELRWNQCIFLEEQYPFLIQTLLQKGLTTGKLKRERKEHLLVEFWLMNKN